MSNSFGLTKISEIILIVLIILSTVAGGLIYFFWIENAKLGDSIKIGVSASLGFGLGEDARHGAILAAEEINAEGGILGKNVEIIFEDAAEFEGDLGKTSSALSRLITFHEVEFVTGYLGHEGTRIMQDLAAQHKIIFLGTGSIDDLHTQRVAEDYEKYKYYFRVGGLNETTTFNSLFNSVLSLREYTGFNKLGYLISATLVEQMSEGFEYLVTVEGFELVYEGAYTRNDIDYSSFLSAAEESGVEILVSFFVNNDAQIIREWWDRQSPMIIWGISHLSQNEGFWELTEGKCEHQSVMVNAVNVGYPITDETIPFREAFIERWGTSPMASATGIYNCIRFVLPEAIERAGTIETEAVLKALEEIDIQSTNYQHFAFTPNHDIMIRSGDIPWLIYQWQENGTRVPVFPKYVMEETGATCTFPDWSGPWDNIS